MSLRQHLASALSLSVLALVATPAPANDPGDTRLLSQEQSCTSVVIRHCHLRYVPDPSSSADTPVVATPDVPGHWEAVRNAAFDDDEILIEGQSLRTPGIREIFERYLGMSPPEPVFVTHPMRGGGRCTTDTRSGVRVCSHGGNEGPAAPGVGGDFSDTVF